MKKQTISKKVAMLPTTPATTPATIVKVLAGGEIVTGTALVGGVVGPLFGLDNFVGCSVGLGAPRAFALARQSVGRRRRGLRGMSWVTSILN